MAVQQREMLAKLSKVEMSKVMVIGRRRVNREVQTVS